MKFSSKIERCELSPMRKYAPYADAAKARGMRIFPRNIGQPDIETPREFFEAVRSFAAPVLEYAPSDGVAEYLEAVRNYYNRIGQTEKILEQGASKAINDGIPEGCPEIGILKQLQIISPADVLIILRIAVPLRERDPDRFQQRPQNKKQDQKQCRYVEKIHSVISFLHRFASTTKCRAF